MKQQRLSLKPEKATVLSKRKDADAGNLAAARVILANPERYAGIQVEWAEMVLKKQES